MTIRLIVGIVFLCAATMPASSLAANLECTECSMRSIRKNDRRWKYSHFGFSAGKILFVLPEYRRLYPHGKLSIRWRLSMFLAVAALAVMIVCLTT